MTIDVTAATGHPSANAKPTATASIFDPRAAGARPAPSSATPGDPISEDQQQRDIPRQLTRGDRRRRERDVGDAGQQRAPPGSADPGESATRRIGAPLR